MKHYFKVIGAKKIKLSKVPSVMEPGYGSETELKTRLDLNREQISDYQTKLYATHQQPVLIIFQGMDTSGKDGAIKHVMSGINPQGCIVTSFKTPTPTELSHDFLWRAHSSLPARGQIGIFNRSYYEEILITKVHHHLVDEENLPARALRQSDFWQHRYRDIMHFEKYLNRQGVEIIKIFIHISKAEQKRRLLARFNDPKKLWKISEGDVEERRYWGQYQKAYEECLGQTSSKKSPWYIVPGDDKDRARLSIAQILVERLKEMKLTFPVLTPAQKSRLKILRAQLARE